MDFLASYPEYEPSAIPTSASDDACTFTLHFTHSARPASTFLPSVAAFFASVTHGPHFPPSRGYIWHTSPPTLTSSNNGDRSWIEGEVKYADSIDDEWFVVWALREATKLWQDDGLVVEAKDGDGQFLLIEAAEALPKWVSPEVADGRVWIKGGQLHLIPPLSDSVASLDPTVALQLLASPSATSTLALPAVASLVDARIDAASPSRLATEHLHLTRACVHKDVARALKARPQLVAQAVRTFYERDPKAVKASSSMRRFTPPATVPPTPSSILLTRPIYAQLRHQTFSPPKPFRSWFDTAAVADGSDEWRRREVGMKVSVAFEMAFDADKDGFALEVEEALKSADEGQASGQGEAEDGEEWLTVSSVELDDLMSSKAGTSREQGEEEVTRSEAEKMKAFAEQMESFVSGKGDFDGATLDDDDDDDMSSDEEEDSEQEDLKADLEMLDDDGRSAKNKAEEKERKRRMEGLVKGLGEGEWGAKSGKTLANGESSRKLAREPQEGVAPGQGEVEMVDAEIGSSGAKSSAARAKEAQTVEGISKSRLARPSYDGYVSESSDEEDADGEDQQGARDAIRDAFGGGGGEAGEEAGDVDMGEEEDEFLAFARDALGLTEDQYEAILDSRRKKGAYVPATSKKPPTAAAAAGHADRPASKGKAVRFTEASEPHAIPPPTHARPSQPAASGAKGPNFASFDRLMSQMDEELKRSSSARGGPVQTPGPDLGHDDGDDDEDSEDDGDDGATFDEAMDAELADLMKSSTGGQGHRDYELVKNFLESFKAQAGMAGPVSGLAGLMGVDLPAWKE